MDEYNQDTTSFVIELFEMAMLFVLSFSIFLIGAEERTRTSTGYTPTWS